MVVVGGGLVVVGGNSEVVGGGSVVVNWASVGALHAPPIGTSMPSHPQEMFPREHIMTALDPDSGFTRGQWPSDTSAPVHRDHSKSESLHKRVSLTGTAF